MLDSLKPEYSGNDTVKIKYWNIRFLLYNKDLQPGNWMISISFWFTISWDIKSWIRNSDLNIFKKGKTGYQSHAKSQRYVYTESLFIWAVIVSFFVQKNMTKIATLN